MEEELKESQQQYQTLVENLPVGIVVHQNGICWNYSQRLNEPFYIAEYTYHGTNKRYFFINV